jgi:transposase, IS30 family
MPVFWRSDGEKASQRRKEASDKPRKMTPDLVELVEEKLTQEQWSPDQISGRLAKDGVACISHERIYQHVWKDKKDGQWLKDIFPLRGAVGPDGLRQMSTRTRAFLRRRARM